MKESFVCRHCGAETPGILRGSGWITFFLILFYILPAIPYAIWRRSGPRRCHVCQQQALVPKTQFDKTAQLEKGTNK